MLKSFFVSVFAAVLMILAGTAGAAEKAPLRIAFIDPLSGPMAGVGVPALAQMKFEANRINKEEGGINGHKVEIVAFDNKLSPQQTLVQFQKAVDDGIRYMALADGDSFASALLNAVNKHNQRNPKDPVLYLNYGAIGPEFTNERCSFWHFLFDDNTDMKMNILTDWVAKQKSIHKVFLINQDYGFGHRVAEDARKMLKEKRPDIKIVGDVFHPLAKVKDFTPYVTQIKQSGADAVITGNWGQDISLLVKAADSLGLKIPFVTYYSNSPGTPSAMGKSGVNRVYLVWGYNGDYKNPQMAKRQQAMKKETGYDYGDIRQIYMLGMLKQAAEKADSIDPTKVAFALEGLTYDGPAGPVTMRAKDHQIEEPMFVSVFTDNMKYGYGNTDGLNFHAIEKFTAQQGEMPTTCHMRRPKQ